MSAVLCIVGDPRLPGVWEKAKQHLLRALVEGRGDRDWSLEDIYAQIVAGRLTLWAMVKHGEYFGFGVSVITAYPQRRVLEVLAMGADDGYEADWLACLEQLKEKAKQWGLSAVIGTGRPGWARKLGAEERRVFEIVLTES